MRKVKVHLVSGDQIAWALNDDLRLTRQSIEPFVDLVDLDSCEVVHALWWQALLRIPPDKLIGKKIVCHLANQPFHTFTHPMFHRLLPLGIHWVTQSTQAYQEMASVGVMNTHIPYSIDQGIFHPTQPGDPVLREFRDQWKLPHDRYLIGSFQRDTVGRDLTSPKAQKGPDVFAEILHALYLKGHPVHAVLAGPRRFWLLRRLDDLGIPYTYIGELIQGRDDTKINNLNQEDIARLYALIDLYLVASRWEGGPRMVLEGVACGCKMVSSRVGLAEDVLEPGCVFDTLPEAVETIARDITSNHLAETVDLHFQKVNSKHVPTANESKFAALYADVAASSPITESQVHTLSGVRSVPPPILLRGVRRISRVIGLHTEAWVHIEKQDGEDSSENLFLALLDTTLKQQSIRSTGSNRKRVDAHLISKADPPAPPPSQCRYVRPPNGKPTITLLPSAQKWQEMVARGETIENPAICPDTVDPGVYNPRGRLPITSGEKVRILFARLPGDSPSQMVVDFPWLEKNLDWSRFSCTIVGQPSPALEHIHPVAWEGAESFASLLKQHHVLIQMESHDVGAHPLLAALSSGLPILYHQGDRAAQTCVGFAGLPFQTMDDLLSQLDLLVEYHQHLRHVIATREVEEVTNAYVTFFRLVRET